ncbi:hypothetical protein AB6813_12240 [bacterium RCC_150]
MAAAQIPFGVVLCCNFNRSFTTIMLGAALSQARHPEQTQALALPWSIVAACIPAQVLVIVLAWVATQKQPK